MKIGIALKFWWIVEPNNTKYTIKNIGKFSLVWRAARLGVNLVQAPYLDIENRYWLEILVDCRVE